MNNHTMLAFSNKLRRALPWPILLALPWGCGSLPDRPAPTTPGQALWSELPGWQQTDHSGALSAFLKSCAVMAAQPTWTAPCAQAASHDPADARTFFQRWFTPHPLADENGRVQGLLTGYYEPLLRGNRSASQHFRHPIYAPPADLLRIDMGDMYPELSRHRLRGRLVQGKVVSYFSRAQIESGLANLEGQELLWVDDAIALFFLHIQGSGKVELTDGSRVRVGYGDQNGHPYRAIGKVLVERGELRKEEVSLQSIRAWLESHPDEAAAVMASNPSYVFFHAGPDSADGPTGTQGVALTAGHSIAVDTRHIALGTPVYIESRWPEEDRPLQRLAIAQDTGGAINGAVRADLFLGSGTQAEHTAGHMKQALRAWMLMPRPSPANN